MTHKTLEEIAQRFPWLADAPLFADASQIERFYDAVVRPPYLEGASVSVRSQTDENSLAGEVSGEVTVGVGGGWLSWLGLGKAEVKGGTKGSATNKTAKSDSRQIQWIPVRSPERQLMQLVLNYVTHAPERLLALDMSNVSQMFDPKVLSTYPRALVILDLPGQADVKKTPSLSPTRLVPMVAELDKGGVVLLYRELRQALIEKVGQRFGEGGVEYLQKKLAALQTSKGHGSPPLPTAVSEATQKEQEQWEKVLSEFDPWTAMRVVEEATVERRIHWIDFRVPINFDGRHETCHLHICPGAKYDTGVFGYNFIHRGFEFGLRIVGTLKAGSDLNVLAIYEK